MTAPFCAAAIQPTCCAARRGVKLTGKKVVHQLAILGRLEGETNFCTFPLLII